MGQGERIEIVNPCPLAPSLKRSLKPQGIKKSLNLRFRPNPIWVAVSLTLILMVSGIVIIWILRDVFFQWFGIDWLGYYGQYDFFFWVANVLWSAMTLLAGLMIIKKRLNLHSRPNPILVAVSLTLFFMVSGLVIIIWIACFIGGSGLYFGVSLIIWPEVTLMAGVVIFVPDVTGRIDRGQTGVREFNKTKATSTLVE